MFQSFRRLIDHRALLHALTIREVRARYRGSALGFLWSFLNPLILLVVYTLVWGYLFVPRKGGDAPTPFGVFLFTGILPWTWFSSALLESSYTVMHGGAVLKKVVFPAEILPLVAVLANAIHFLVALPVLAVVLVWTGHIPGVYALAAIPLVLVQLLLTSGLALFVSALSVLFRDVPQLLGHMLTLLFFASPIIYEVQMAPEGFKPVIRHNPLAQLIIGWQNAFFFNRPPAWGGLLTAALAAVVVFVLGYAFFDRLREVFPEEV